MITPQNRIIIVDDEKKELDDLTDEFLQLGLGIRPFLYKEGEYNESFIDVRIAFFDINIVRSTSVVEKGELSEEDFFKANVKVFNDLANAINSFISIDNGPYALIFWTKNNPLINGFKNYIDERGIELAKPFYIGCIDKTEINNNLLEKLIEVLNNDKIKFYFELEENARLAGSKAVNKLHSIIPKDDKWSENSTYFENIDKVLSKIAVNVLGYDYAKEKPIKGIYEGLSQILLKDFLNSDSTIDSKKLLNSLETSSSFNEIKFPVSFKESKLNSIYHISEGDFDKDYRGVVIELNKEKKGLLNWLNIPDENIENWFKKIIPFKKNEKHTEVFSNSKLICVEISPACDFSQKNHRTNNYMLGFLTPTFNVKKDLNSKRPVYSYNIAGSNFFIAKTNTENQIWLNLNFVFSSKTDAKCLGETLFAFNKEIVDMIGQKYASHVSRIGITSF